MRVPALSRLLQRTQRGRKAVCTFPSQKSKEIKNKKIKEYSARADQQVSLQGCLGAVMHENKNQRKCSMPSTIKTNHLKANLIIAVFITADLPLLPPAPIRAAGRWELLQPLYLRVLQPRWQKAGWRQRRISPPLQLFRPPFLSPSFFAPSLNDSHPLTLFFGLDRLLQ